MDRVSAEVYYRTRVTWDDAEGWTSLELMAAPRTAEHVGEHEMDLIARVTYWDALGQFYLEMLVDEMPLIIVEELVAEAKAVIRTK